MSAGSAGGEVGRFRDEPINRIFAEIDVFIHNLGQKIQKNEITLWLIVLSCFFLFSAIWPLTQSEFSFREIFLSRLCLAASPLPLIAIFFVRRESRFNLGFFKVNAPKSRHSPIRDFIVNFVIYGALLSGLLYLIDPIGVYASRHSKATILIFYITDRETIPANSPNSIVFSDEPSYPERLTYGIGEVPIQWNRRDVIHNLGSKVALSQRMQDIRLYRLSSEEFSGRIAATASESPRHDAFLFVHGFHNTFEDAVNRTAKLSYDLKFRGASILYSWPSGSDTSSYDHEYENASWSEKHLTTSLKDLAATTGLQKLDLIAHSMGNRVLARAIDSTGWPNNPVPFTNIVMAAPDIDQAEFEQAAESLESSSGRVTVYVSNWDIALLISGVLHKGRRTGSRPLHNDGIDVIDTEGKDTSMSDFKHGYLFDSQPVLTDIFELIQHDAVNPASRSAPRRNDGECCWRLEHR